jgi:hypothetical protein
VEEVVDVTLQRRGRAVVDPQPRLRKVADNGLDPILLAPAVGQLVDRALAHEHIDVPLALEQPFNQEASDESGPAGHEICHGREPNP